ncbi:MAG: hypothetical protein K2X55_04395 [Burkholderiaceae bacterium]|nr:hypothetical protein [Burkholderiaceae bacterium]
MPGPLDLILALAADFNAVGVLNGETTAELSVNLQRVDGRSSNYIIQVWCEGGRLRAKEFGSKLLPSFCPERHINPGGSFCMYWEGSEQLDVVDESSAKVWMETLIQFLRLQERAAQIRRWPSHKAWAHGGAAKYQLHALEAASALGNSFLTKLEAGALSVNICPRRGRNPDSIIEVKQDGIYLFSIWKSRRMLVNRRRKCFCGVNGSRRSKRIGRCKNHAAAALALAEGLLAWKTADKQFWESLQGAKCCGTCDGCPLAKP